jgi:hypothetical protein
MHEIDEAQAAVCERFGVDPFQASADLKVGVSRDIGSGQWPIHGLRHPPQGDTTGWYIWSGEYSDADDFFQPLHVAHLPEDLPEVLPYLALPPGWRFLIAPGHEDIWWDEKLLLV